MFTKQCNKLYFTSDTDNVNTSSFELFTDINVINNNRYAALYVYSVYTKYVGLSCDKRYNDW